MESTLIILDTFYNWPLVLLSLFAASAGSYVALEINARISKIRSRRGRIGWMLIGALTMGSAIWSMHFIGMSAFQLRIPLTYNWGLTFFSILPAFVASFLAFYVLQQKRLRWQAITAAGLLMGFGISGMHYTGMAAITFAGTINYNGTMVLLATLIAIAVSFAALFLFSYSRFLTSIPKKLGVAIIMGLAISSMHYTGIGGSSFCLPEQWGFLVQPDPVTTNNVLGMTTLAAITMMFTSVQFILRHEEKWDSRMNFVDPVTELPNRRSFNTMSEKEFTRYGLLITLESTLLRTYDETWGVKEADWLVEMISREIKVRTPAESALYHVDGHRFSVLLPQAEEALLRRQAKFISDAYTIAEEGREEDMYVPVSAGASFITADKSKSQTIQEAETALRNTRKHTEPLSFFDREKDDIDRENQLIQALGRALKEKELQTHYQVKVCLQTGSADDAEALVRWYHPDYGMISPGEFIPVAERHGLIMPITEYMLYEVCRQLQKWDQEGMRSMKAAVNLSARHFHLVGANRRLINIVESMHIDPSRIEFEVTETAAVADLDQAVRLLEELRRAGFTIALDDFGTGLSSLTYLQKLPADTLKIDKSFIDTITSSEKNQAVVKLMIDFAENAGMKTVGEGVETKEQAEILTELGCHYGQGYFFQKPVHPSQLQTLFSIRQQA
ncbi:putative bifunctional diguanylate cyclase/phosphodiesterase [Alkalicoccus urumqiensis]|nr:EAL domain-containing protein [Alkalicoccus urumqiensis]